MNISRTRLLLSALLTLFFLAGPVAEALAAPCKITYTLYNRHRKVAGPVNVECTGLHDDQGYGNWGVLSAYGGIYNGGQFAGWKLRGGKRQWQSCTSENPPPNFLHYNDNAYTTQKAAPYNTRTFAHKVLYGPNNQTCRNYFSSGVVVLQVSMNLYELDWPDSDDHVTTLSYGTLTVPITCTSSWRCEGYSAWKSKSSAGVSADVRARVRGR